MDPPLGSGRFGVPDAGELATLWELSSELFSILSSDGRVRRANRAWERAVGWSIDQLRERPIVDFVHPEDAEATQAVLEQLRRPEQEVSGHEHRFRHRDGGYRRLCWHALSDADGERIYSVTTDTTEQRAAEDALRASEQRWRLVQQQAPIGLAIVDAEGTWRAVNPALCDLVGYSEDELLGGKFQDITHPDDLDVDYELLDRFPSEGLAHHRWEKRYLRKDGGVVWILVAVSAVHDDTGRPTHYISQIVDITEAKRHEQERERLVGELQAVNDHLERFAAMAAHDLRSPLATVGGLVELVRTGDDQLGPESRQLLDRAGATVERLKAVTDGLLRYARAGSEELDVQPQDTNALVSEAADLLAGEVARRGAEIDVAPLPPVRADAETLGSVLRNLIDNAVRHAAAGGTPKVTIRGERLGPKVEITIEDRGPGIAADQLESVFEPFVHGASQGRGTGIGLAIARHMAERNGGSLHAEPRPGGGARMVLRVPAAAGRA